MKHIFHKVLVLGLFVVILSACSAATASKENSENKTEDNLEESAEATEVHAEESIVADEMTTTYYPKVTKLRDLTEEDHEWYDIIMTRLNAIDDFSGDRETVYEIAEEYGEDPEELWTNWLEIVDAKFHENLGEYAILQNDFQTLHSEIIDKNIVGENIEQIGNQFELDDETLTSSTQHEIDVDGETYEVHYKMDHKDDFEVAEIIEFSVNGQEIDL